MPDEDYGFLDDLGFEFWSEEEIDQFEQAARAEGGERE